MSKPTNDDFARMMKRVKKNAEKERRNLQDWLQKNVAKGEKVVPAGSAYPVPTLVQGRNNALKGNTPEAVRNRDEVRRQVSLIEEAGVGKLFSWASSRGFDLNDVALYSKPPVVVTFK